MLASIEWGSDLAEVAVMAVARFNIMLIPWFAYTAGKFLVDKVFGYFVKLHFRRAGEVDVLGSGGGSLGGQGDGRGDGRLLACCGQGKGVVDGRLLALGGSHVFGRLVDAYCIFRWVLSLPARFNDVC